MQKSQQKYIYVLIFILAFAIRLWDLNARSLWFDEAYEYWSAQVSVLSLPETVNTSFQPPLYTFLLHLWLKISFEPFWLRFFSVGLSLLTIAGTMAIAYKVTGYDGAVVAGILMALLPTEVKYAQEVAEYSLMECMLTWSLYYLYVSVERPTLRNLALWSVFSLLSVYSHYGTAIIVFATTSVVFFENVLHRQWRDIFRRAWVSICCLILEVPLFFYFLLHQMQSQSAGTPAPIVSIAAEVNKLVLALGDTFIFPITGWPFSSIPKYLGLIPIFTIFLLALFVLAFRPKRATIVLIWFWISFIVYFVFVRVGFYAYGNYGFRYGLVLIPLFVVLIAVTFVKLVVPSQLPIQIPKMIASALGVFASITVLAIVSLSIYSLPNRSLSEITRPNSAWPETQDIRDVMQYWMANRKPNEHTYVYYGAVPAFRYYLRLESYYETNVPLPSLWYTDCWKDSKHDYCTSGNVFYGRWVRALSPDQKYASLRETMGEMSDHFWIIFSHIYPNEDVVILETLSHNYEITESRQYQGASVYHLDRK